MGKEIWMRLTIYAHSHSAWYIVMQKGEEKREFHQPQIKMMKNMLFPYHSHSKGKCKCKSSSRCWCPIYISHQQIISMYLSMLPCVMPIFTFLSGMEYRICRMQCRMWSALQVQGCCARACPISLRKKGLNNRGACWPAENLTLKMNEKVLWGCSTQKMKMTIYTIIQACALLQPVSENSKQHIALSSASKLKQLHGHCLSILSNQ